MISQQTFLIPPEIEAGLAVGELIQYGGIVRNPAGQIVRHLKALELPVESDKVAARGLKMLKNRKVVAGAAVVAFLAAGAAVLVGTRRRNRAVPECVAEYNACLATYLEAVRRGQLDAHIIERLIVALDSVEAYFDGDGSIALDFSTAEVAVLVNLVIDSTKQLAEDNSFELEELDEPMTVGRVVDIRPYLQVQRQLFQSAG